MKLLSELHREFQKPLHVAYVDLKSAFDSVDRKALWLALKGKGIRPLLQSLIEELYSGSSARIRIGRSFSKCFITVSGVRQGCVLAPAMFNLAIDYIMEHVSHKVGIRIESDLFTDLDYTDDITLFVDKPEALSNAVETMKQESAKFGLHVSWTKNKNTECGSWTTSQLYNSQWTNVDGVSEFTYLSHKIVSNNNSMPDCLRRTALASRAMSDLADVWQ